MLCCSAKFAPQNAKSLDIGGVAHAKIEKKKKSMLTLSKPIMILLQKVCLEESTWNYDSEFIFEGTWIWKAPKKSKTVILMSSQSILIILRYTK